MASLLFEYEKYKKLFLFESIAICHFFEGDKENLIQLLISGNDLSSGMREFLADVVRGEAKLKRGKRRQSIDRDSVIFFDMTELLYEGYTLRPNRGGDGAALEIAKKYNIVDKHGDFGEETVIKIYQKVKKDYEEYEKINRETFHEMMEEEFSGRQSDKPSD
jgi:hypothetical protein